MSIKISKDENNNINLNDGVNSAQLNLVDPVFYQLASGATPKASIFASGVSTSNFGFQDVDLNNLQDFDGHTFADLTALGNYLNSLGISGSVIIKISQDSSNNYVKLDTGSNPAQEQPANLVTYEFITKAAPTVNVRASGVSLSTFGFENVDLRNLRDSNNSRFADLTTLDSYLAGLGATVQPDALNGFVFATGYDPSLGADNTAWLQNLVDTYAGTSWRQGKYTTIYLPAGVIEIDKLILRQGLILKGAGREATILKARQPATGSNFSGQGLVELPLTTFPDGSVSGEVIANSGLKDLQLKGIGNAGQMGIYFHGVLNVQDQLGGLSDCDFDNVQITGFASHGMWLRADTPSINGPMQLSTFKNFKVERGTEPGARALLTTGQFCQMNFIGGTFMTSGDADEAAVEISREYQLKDAQKMVIKAGGYSISGNYDDGISPFGPIGVNIFINTTFYSYDLPTHKGKGVILDMCSATKFLNCQFENLPRAIEMHFGCVGVSVDNCGFLECGNNNGTSTGWYVNADNTCQVAVRDCWGINTITTRTPQPFVGCDVENFNFSNQDSSNTLSKVDYFGTSDAPLMNLKQLGNGPVITAQGKVNITGNSSYPLTNFKQLGSGPALVTQGGIGINTEAPFGLEHVRGTAQAEQAPIRIASEKDYDFIETYLSSAGDGVTFNASRIVHTYQEIKYYFKGNTLLTRLLADIKNDPNDNGLDFSTYKQVFGINTTGPYKFVNGVKTYL